MPARSTAYYLLLKHTSRTVDSYCSFLDIQHFNSLLLRTLPPMRDLEKEHGHAGAPYPRC
jgi:hypothetical protein